MKLPQGRDMGEFATGFPRGERKNDTTMTSSQNGFVKNGDQYQGSTRKKKKTQTNPSANCFKL